jgi:hypothetical protein
MKIFSILPVIDLPGAFPSCGGMGMLAMTYSSRLHNGCFRSSRTIDGCEPMLAVSPKLSWLNASSLEPSASTITFSGRPLPSVRRAMPLTKASITVKSAMTAVKARAVISVIRQRTSRLRRL